MGRVWTPEEQAIVSAVADRITDLRLMQGMQRRELAKRSGVSEGGLERIELEGGTNMHITTLVAIARALNVQPGALLPSLPQTES